MRGNVILCSRLAKFKNFINFALMMKKRGAGIAETQKN
jgi:hypothetical protein